MKDGQAVPVSVAAGQAPLLAVVSCEGGCAPGDRTGSSCAGTAGRGSSRTPWRSSRSALQEGTPHLCTSSTPSRATCSSSWACRCCSRTRSSATGSAQRLGLYRPAPRRAATGQPAHLAARRERRRPPLAAADDARAEGGACPAACIIVIDHHQQRPRDGAQEARRGGRGRLRAVRPARRHPPRGGRRSGPTCWCSSTPRSGRT